MPASPGARQSHDRFNGRFTPAPINKDVLLILRSAPETSRDDLPGREVAKGHSKIGGGMTKPRGGGSLAAWAFPAWPARARVKSERAPERNVGGCEG